MIARATSLALLTALLSCLFIPATTRGADGLSDGFRSPPDSAKPHTWWHWMNGNITKEGITADLEAMKRVGVGGAQIFNADCGIAKGPVNFMSPQWRELTKHAVQEADRLGIELCIHNCAGWSSSGGPWNTPEHAMQFVTTSEVQVKGPSHFAAALPQPPAKCDFYRDIAVLAFPTPAAEAIKMADVVASCSSSEPKVDPAKLFAPNGKGSITLPLPTTGHKPWIQFEFKEPYKAQSLLLKAADVSDSIRGTLEASDNGTKFRKIDTFNLARNNGSASSHFDATTARFYRLSFTNAGLKLKHIRLTQVDLSARLTIDNLDAKAAFTRSENPGRDSMAADEHQVIQREAIVDLTSRLKSDGQLDWDVPAGNWTILRLGHTPTGKTNHPAPAEGLGLECDKLSREAAELHWAGMMGKVIADIGPLAGKSLNNVLIDSYEVHNQNWTPKFREDFIRLRGYDPLPFLPAFSNRVVQSTPITERFLWDLRRTIADLFTENYAGTFAILAHKNGMKFSVEPYGDGPFEDLFYGGQADIPMGEFWAGTGSSSGSCKLAASVGHIYGHSVIGAESFTAAPAQGKWQNDPYSFKALGDRIYCLGVNRFIFHRYAHQPWMDKLPGMTMGQWGFHFERTNTWWEQGSAWLKYLARCQYMLQQGLFVADACYFNGENAPSGMPRTNPSLPAGYDFDGCSGDVILNRMSVKDGRLVLPDGMSYRMLILPQDETMTPTMLRKIRQLVQDGATVVGPRPLAAPTLQNYPACDAEVKTLADELWSNCDGKTVTEHALGKGKIVWGKSLDDLFAAMTIKPDFEFIGSAKASRALFIHRNVDGVDVYFVSNQRNESDEIRCTFRVTGKAPELWHPDTGVIEKAPVYTESDGRTTVPLRLDPAGSVFVVFRQSAAGDHVVAANWSGKVHTQTPAAQIQITKAVYEAIDGAGSVDVTNRLNKMIQDGSLIAPVDNGTLGKDPAFNHHKQLRVDYVLNGKPMSATLPESATLELPETGRGVIDSAYALQLATDGKLQVLAWRNGQLELKTAAGKTIQPQLTGVPSPVEVAGPWEIHFPPKWGAPEKTTFDHLISWTDHSDEGIKYFSGTATYIKEIDIPADLIGDGKLLSLDLGQFKNLAEVKLNGSDLGILWKPPFRVDITALAKPGKNSLEIRITNMWCNRLIGDERLPENKRYTFTTWKHFKADSPLLESGLLGPVRLIPGIRRSLD